MIITHARYQSWAQGNRGSTRGLRRANFTLLERLLPKSSVKGKPGMEGRKEYLQVSCQELDVVEKAWGVCFVVH